VESPSHHSGPRGPGRILLTAVLFAAPWSGACEAVPRTSIEGEDDGVLFPTGRVSWQFSSSRSASPPGEDAAAAPVTSPTRTLAELDLSYGSGGFTQAIQEGEVVQVGSLPFAGVDEVDVDAQLWIADLAGRLERRWENGLGLGGRLGVRYSDLDLGLSAGALRDSTDLSSLGLLVGGELSFEPAETLRLFLAGNASWGVELSGVASGYEELVISSLDLGLAWRVHESAQLVGAWRRLDYQADSVDDYLSDLELTLSGPMLGLWVSF